MIDVITSVKVLKMIPLTIFCAMLIVSCSSDNSDSTPQEKANKGFINLQDWDFRKNGNISLEGEWAFWWKKIIPPDRIDSFDQSVFVQVPEIWTNYEIEGQTITPEGWATYYLKLSPPEIRQTYGLYIEGQGSVYAL